MKPQVSIDHYQRTYDTKERFISYWTQINEVLRLQPASILEIGVGTKFVTDYLKQREFSIRTLDIADDLFPDILGSVTELPVQTGAFDLVMACQVLEHLPFDLFANNLREMARVSRKYVLISLPDQATVVSIYYHLPLLGVVRWQINANVWRRFKPFHPDKQHYWELGWANYSTHRIIEVIREVGLQIVSHYRVFEFPYHHFFILEK